MLIAIASGLELIGFALISIPIFSFVRVHLHLAQLRKHNFLRIGPLVETLADVEKKSAVFPSKTETILISSGFVITLAGMIMKFVYYFDHAIA